MPDKTEVQQPVFQRSNRLLMKKFRQYLIPTMITEAAMSLNEFADSMVVSRLLGSHAMAIVGLGAPIMLAVAAIYCLLGSGGATIYAIALGRRDHETAGKSFTASMIVGTTLGLILLLMGLLFFKQLSAILCNDPATKPLFDPYLLVTLICTPLLVAILTFVEFLPPSGLPAFATAVNVVANVVNIVMDYVYIRIFGMGVEGAAWATLTGYICGLVVVLYAVVKKKLTLYISKNLLESLKMMVEIIKLGASDSMSQLGFTLQYGVCNTLALSLAGISGVVAYSLCQQSLSIISIFISSLIGASLTMMAVLHGQHDYRGETNVLKISLGLQLLVSIVLAGCFTLFAPQLAGLFNITEPAQKALAVHALRLFSLVYLIRGATIIYFRYLKVIGLTGYATLISSLDGFLSLIPVVWILCKLIGIDGIWLGYPVNAALIMGFMLLRNQFIRKKSDGRLQGILLLEHDVEAEPVMDITITKDASTISNLSLTLQQVCQKNGLNRLDAMKAALAVEEMAVYASTHKKQDSYMDVLVRIYKGQVEIDFRSLGESFNPLDDDNEDIEENIRMLRGVTSNIDTEYIMGMNATRITI